jgi:hypothetical protein
MVNHWKCWHHRTYFLKPWKVGNWPCTAEIFQHFSVIHSEVIICVGMGKVNLLNLYHTTWPYASLWEILVNSIAYHMLVYVCVCVYLVVFCRKLSRVNCLLRCSVILKTCHHQLIHLNFNLNQVQWEGESEVSMSFWSHMQSRGGSCSQLSYLQSEDI